MHHVPTLYHHCGRWWYHVAIAELPTGATLTGSTAWLAWLGVHLALLNGVEQRASTVVDWGWSFVTHGRSKQVLLGAEEWR